ncbi:hypothetical protein ALC53_01296 [Atta colombica]|uniref:Uncharacterized protein n=1 Tax=Atta colombica TaxID=520822 RepID=A0A195BW88_9HYME|nr:hypothetical protein ALC53_01296 [Atta colombica]
MTAGRVGWLLRKDNFSSCTTYRAPPRPYTRSISILGKSTLGIENRDERARGNVETAGSRQSRMNIAGYGVDIPFRQRVDIDEGVRTKGDDNSLSSPLDAFSKCEDIRKWMHTPPSSPVRFRMTQGLSKRNRSDIELARMMRAVVAASPLLLSRAHRYLPTYSTARRTGECKWYIHYYPQSNGWNLLGDKLLRPPTLLGEFRDSIRVEAERDTF